MRLDFNSILKTISLFFFSIIVYAADKTPTPKIKKETSNTGTTVNTAFSKLENYLLDAKFSFHRGDYFRALKLLELAKSIDEKEFLVSDEFSIYVKSLASLGNIRELKRICNGKIPPSAAYQCAHSYYQLGLNKDSLRVIKKLKDNSEQLALLAAANYLALKNAEQCIASLTKVKFSAKFLDLKALSFARCHILKRDYDTAISYYKNVSSDSKHYMDALYEMAWAQFKERNIGDTKATIDVLLSSYSEFSDDRSEISQNEYFSLRYLRAYLGLVQTGASNVEEDLSLALQDIKNIKQKVDVSDKKALEVLKHLNEANKTWAELTTEGADFQSFIDFFSNWGSAFKNRQLMESMKFHLALSLEKKNIKKYKNPKYEAWIIELHKEHLAKLSIDFIESFRTTLQALNGFELRIQLAKQKKNVLAETEGLRNLEQAKEIYQNKVNYINQLVGGVQ
jgi:hypothetical protein